MKQDAEVRAVQRFQFGAVPDLKDNGLFFLCDDRFLFPIILVC